VPLPSARSRIVPPLPMRRILPLTIALACLVTPAANASPAAVIRDCADGSLNHRYSSRDLRTALANLPTDVAEYTDCSDTIRAAQLAAGAGGTGGPGGTTGGAKGAPGSTGGVPASPKAVLATATPAERSVLDRAKDGAGPSIEVGGRTIVPGAASFTADSVRHALPAPLIVVLALLGLGALAAGAIVARSLVRR